MFSLSPFSFWSSIIHILVKFAQILIWRKNLNALWVRVLSFTDFLKAEMNGTIDNEDSAA